MKRIITHTRPDSITPKPEKVGHTDMHKHFALQDIASIRRELDMVEAYIQNDADVNPAELLFMVMRLQEQCRILREDSAEPQSRYIVVDHSGERSAEVTP